MAARAGWSRRRSSTSAAERSRSCAKARGTRRHSKHRSTPTRRGTYNAPMSEANVQQFLQVLSIALIPGLLAITLHEVSHGWVAKQLGDPTAYMLGRLTVNPLKHVDPLGTVVVPIAMLLLSGGSMAFGWA